MIGMFLGGPGPKKEKTPFTSKLSVFSLDIYTMWVVVGCFEQKSTSIGSQKVLHLGLKEDPQGPEKRHRKRFGNFGTIKPVDKLVAYIPVGLKKGEQRALLTVRHFEVQTSMTL